LIIDHVIFLFDNILIINFDYDKLVFNNQPKNNNVKGENHLRQTFDFEKHFVFCCISKGYLQKSL